MLNPPPPPPHTHTHTFSVIYSQFAKFSRKRPADDVAPVDPNQEVPGEEEEKISFMEVFQFADGTDKIMLLIGYVLFVG